MEYSPKTIFIVDDDATCLQMVKSALQCTYNVYTLKSGELMFKLLEKIHPDLILLDIKMPGMSGYEVMNLLKNNEKTKQIPVIFLTGKESDGDELQGLSMGAVDFLTKPLSVPRLCKRVEIHLSIDEKRRELVEYNTNLEKKVQERIRKEQESMQLQKQIYEASPIPFSLWNEYLEFVDCNMSFVELLGAPDKQDVLDKLLSDYQPPHQPCGTPSRDKAVKMLRDAFKTGRNRLTWVNTHRDGSQIYGDMTVVRLDVDGRRMLACYFQDLRPLREANEKLSEADEVRNILLGASPFIMNIWDDSISLVSTSQQSVEMFELNNQQEYVDLFPKLSPECQPDGTKSDEKAADYVKQALNQDEQVKFEWMHCKLDGELIPTEVTLVRFMRQGRYFVAAYTVDLRPVKAAMERANKAEKKLREQEVSQRIQLMLDAAPLMVEFWNKEYRAVDCNQTTLDYYGHTTKDEYKENLFAHSPGFQPNGTPSRVLWNNNLEKIFEHGSGRFEFMEKINYAIAYQEVYGVRTMYNDEVSVVTYSNDITQAKKLQEEQRRVQIAEEANRAKTMFIANMSHEIRTPLNSILGYSELALDDLISNETREYLDKIVINAKWLIGVIGDLLDISKIESGSLELEEIPFDPEQFVEHCRSIVAADVKDKGLCLSFDTKNLKKRNVQLLGDPTKLTQVCVNILSNAVKFTESGSITFAISTIGCPEDVCKQSCTKNTCTLKFEFIDTGIGMTEEQVLRIFEPFTQGDSSTTRKYGGTGLGLAISTRLIDAMGGRLAVESKPGAGSNFSFVLSFKTADRNTVREEASEISCGNDFKKGILLKKPAYSGQHILVVDDNAMNLGVVCDHLRRVGLKSFIATNGGEAVEIVRQRMVRNEPPFDLILMDIHMPEMDGKEAASVIGGFGLGIPIIAMTAETVVSEDEYPYIEYGMEGYLSKPFTSQDLWALLNKYFG